jgi:hypothetical protein
VRTLLLVCLLLALVVVAVREPGEGYPETALRLISEASDAAARIMGSDAVADRVARRMPGVVTPLGSNPPSSGGELHPSATERTSEPDRPTDATSSRPPMTSAPPTPPLPTSPGERDVQGREPPDALPEFLLPSPEGDRLREDVGRIEPRALYREATRLLEAIDR